MEEVNLQEQSLGLESGGDLSPIVNTAFTGAKETE